MAVLVLADLATSPALCGQHSTCDHLPEVSLHVAVQHMRETRLGQVASSLEQRLSTPSWSQLAFSEDKMHASTTCPHLTSCEPFMHATSLFFDHLIASSADVVASLLPDVYDSTSLLCQRPAAKKLLIEFLT